MAAAFMDIYNSTDDQETVSRNKNNKSPVIFQTSAAAAAARVYIIRYIYSVLVVAAF